MLHYVVEARMVHSMDRFYCAQNGLGEARLLGSRIQHQLLLHIPKIKNLTIQSFFLNKRHIRTSVKLHWQHLWRTLLVFECSIIHMQRLVNSWVVVRNLIFLQISQYVHFSMWLQDLNVDRSFRRRPTHPALEQRRPIIPVVLMTSAATTVTKTIIKQRQKITGLRCIPQTLFFLFQSARFTEQVRLRPLITHQSNHADRVLRSN